MKKLVNYIKNLFTRPASKVENFDAVIMLGYVAEKQKDDGQILCIVDWEDGQEEIVALISSGIVNGVFDQAIADAIHSYGPRANKVLEEITKLYEKSNDEDSIKPSQAFRNI